jgi:hypothetical protein
MAPKVSHADVRGGWVGDGVGCDRKGAGAGGHGFVCIVVCVLGPGGTWSTGPPVVVFQVSQLQAPLHLLVHLGQLHTRHTAGLPHGHHVVVSLGPCSWDKAIM